MQMQDDEEKKVKVIFLMCAYSSRHHFQFGKVNQHSSILSEIKIESGGHNPFFMTLLAEILLRLISF